MKPTVNVGQIAITGSFITIIVTSVNSKKKMLKVEASCWKGVALQSAGRRTESILSVDNQNYTQDQLLFFSPNRKKTPKLQPVPQQTLNDIDTNQQVNSHKISSNVNQVE